MMTSNDRLMASHRYTGPKHVVDEVFKMLDTDGDGSIGFDELFEFIKGKRHSLDARTRYARSLHLAPPPKAEYTLNEINWDVETLRVLIVQASAITV